MTQLSLFEQHDSSEIILLKKKVNELVTAVATVEAHVDALKSTGNTIDEEWIENFCYEILLRNEKETI